MQTELHTDPKIFDQLIHEWNALVTRSHSDTIFLTHEWQKTWWEHLSTGDLCLVTVRNDAHLVGIAPLHWECVDSVDTLSFVGCTDVSDYLDFIIARGWEEPVYTAVLDALEAIPWATMNLCNIRANSPSLTMLAELCRARGYQVQIEREDVCPIITLPDTWEAYLASLDKKQRHEIRRKMRRAENEAETRWYIVGPEHDLDAEVRDFIALHQKSSAEKGQFMDEQMQAFFHAIARALFKAGWLQLAFIEMNDEKAASIFNFDYNNTILVYNSGYDPENHAHLSPGIVLLSYAIRHAIEQGRSHFDFLRGDEVYKYRFGAQNTEIFRLDITRA